jgi:hypothetical protein
LTGRKGALLLLLAGCAGAPPKVSLAPSPAPPPAKRYVEELKRFSRHGHILSDLDETLTLDATLMAPEFVAAQAEKWIDLYKLNDVDGAALRAKRQAETADVWELHIESSGHRYEVNDFGPRLSPWRIRLVDEHDRAVAPIEVKSDRTPRDVVLAFYPYGTLFSRSWTVRFPRVLPDGTPLVGPDTRALIFRVSGPAGVVDLTWRLK